MILTIPSGWQKKFNKLNVEVKDRMDDPVPQEILDELNTFEDFRRAYPPDGMTTEEFDSFGATRFVASSAPMLNCWRSFGTRWFRIRTDLLLLTGASRRVCRAISIRLASVEVDGALRRAMVKISTPEASVEAVKFRFVFME